MTASQKRGLEVLWPRYGIDFQPQPLDFSQLFDHYPAPVHMEIGFGMAENLIAVAKAKPTENFIGVEVHEPGVGNALNQIEELQLKNLRLIKHDAVEVLRHQIPDHSLDSVSIFFPDPWHKKKHHKRRLINRDFTELLSKKLKAGGKVYLATDWENYAEQMLEVFSSHPSFRNTSPDNRYSERIPFRALTKFERRGQRLGHGVWDLVFERCKLCSQTRQAQASQTQQQ